MNADVAKTQHERVGNFHRTWQLVADDLLFASHVLRERCDLIDESTPVDAPTISSKGRLGAVELMLRGMAVECLLKALWLKNGNKLVDSGEFKNVGGAGSHDLPQLAHEVGLTLTKLEIDVLRRLSHFVEYGGRYPIPKNPIKLRLTQSPRGGKSSALTWSAHGDNQLFEAIVQHLTAMLA